MRKISAVAISLTLTIAPANALKAYNSSSLTCAGLQSIIEREKAVYVRYPSTRNPGITLGGRFVPTANYCESAKRAIPIPVATRDNRSCIIRICREQLDDAFN